MAPTEKRVSFTELEKHKSQDDIWIVVAGKVYDMTNFAPSHPGGQEIIYQYAARDASEAYDDVHPPKLISDTLAQSEQIGTFDAETAPQDWKSSGKTQSQVKDSSEVETPLLAIVNLQDFEDSAQESLSKKNWAFIAGAANDNITRDANKDYFQKIWFRPRIMRNVKEVSTRAKMLGCNVSLPIFISPCGLGKTGGPDGEIALSSGAASTGIIEMISTNASYPLDDILKAAPDDYPFFFQLYVEKDRSKTEKLLAQIDSEPKIKAIFVTVDLPVVSKREADERVKIDSMETSGISGGKTGADKKGSGLARSVGSAIDPGLNWDDLAWLRKHTKLPLLLKGVQTAADARMAYRLGCQGIMVSNHGGRAMDNAQPAIMVLLELHMHCPEVFDQMEIYIDGGIRRGSDVLKALCLGASGVGLGRPFLYALKYGKEGVEHAVSILQDEVETAMRLCGLQTLEDADPSYLNTRELDQLLPPNPDRHPYAYKHVKLEAKARL